jgi:PAS domain S-box-containing protein
MSQDSRVLEVALQAVSDAVLVVDGQDRVCWCNDAAVRIFGPRCAGAVGRELSALVPEPECAELTRALRLARHEGTKGNVRNDADPPRLMTLQREDGSPVLLSIAAAPVDGSPPPGSIALVVRDETRTRALNERLIESSARADSLAAQMQSYLEQADEFAFRQDAGGELTYVSPSVQRLTGYTVEELKTTFAQLLTDHPMNRAAARLRTRTLMTGKAPPPHPIELRVSGGGRVVFELKSKAELDGHRVVGIIGLARDVTQRYRAEAALRENQALLETLVRAVPVGVFRTDATGKLTFVNLRWCDMMGLSPEVADGGWRERIHPEDRARVEAAWGQALLDGSQFDAEYRVITGDGAILCVVATAVPERAPHGGLEGYVGTLSDVTHRKAAEDNVLRLARAVDAAADVVVITDREGVIQQVNPAFTLVTGYSAAEAVGAKSSILKSGRQNADLYRELWRVITAGEVWSGRLVNQRKDGAVYHAALTIAPIKDEDGTVVGFVGIHRDVTGDITREEQIRGYARTLAEVNRELEDRKRELEAQHVELESMNRELAQASDEAKAANKAKSEFLANMSHELRTPMTAVQGFADLLYEELSAAPRCDGPCCVERDEHVTWVDSLRRNAKHLLSIINDILDLSKIEAGRLVLHHEPFVVRAFVEDLAAMFQHRAVESGIALVVEIADDVPEVVESDPMRLRQILINLIGNALKFTEAGEVRVTVAPAPGAPGPLPCLSFAIADTGIGMKPEAMRELFQPFVQLHHPPAGKASGTGLGLAISRRLAHILGGEVHAQSSLGSGSTFTTIIPVEVITNDSEPPADRAPVHETEKPETGRAPLENLRVLLADDAIEARKLVSTMLRRAGAEMTCVENGERAVHAALAESRRAQPFDLILMDMHMPVMDGYAAVRRLRAAGYDGPIVALTADALDGSRERCIQCGCDEFISKPVERDHLIAAIARCAARAPRASACKVS